MQYILIVTPINYFIKLQLTTTAIRHAVYDQKLKWLKVVLDHSKLSGC